MQSSVVVICLNMGWLVAVMTGQGGGGGHTLSCHEGGVTLSVTMVMTGPAL